jgi:hypothetical protein
MGPIETIADMLGPPRFDGGSELVGRFWNLCFLPGIVGRVGRPLHSGVKLGCNAIAIIDNDSANTFNADPF